MVNPIFAGLSIQGRRKVIKSGGGGNWIKSRGVEIGLKWYFYF